MKEEKKNTNNNMILLCCVEKERGQQNIILSHKGNETSFSGVERKLKVHKS